MYRVFALARISGRRFRTRCGLGLAVALRYHRVLVVIYGIEGLCRSVADSTAKLTVFLITVEPTVTIYVVIFQPRAFRRLRLFFIVPAVVPSGSFPATLGAIIARDTAELFEELVINFEVFSVGFGIIPDVGIRRVAAGLVLFAGGLVLPAGVGVIGGRALGVVRTVRAMRAVRTEGDSATHAGARRARRGRQGSGLYGGHPQGLVLLLLDGRFDLSARVRDVHACWDLRCKTDIISLQCAKYFS